MDEQTQSPGLIPKNHQRIITKPKSFTRPVGLQKQYFSPPKQDYVPPRPSIKIMKHIMIPTKQPDETNNLKRLIINKQDKIIELEFFNSFLQDCLKKKEDLAKKYNEENLKLREELVVREKIIQNLKDELKKSKNSFPEILSAKSNGRASSTRRYRAGEYERIVSPSDEVKLNKLRVTELKNFSQINWDNASPFSRSDKGSKSSIKRTEEDVQKVLLTERESIKITEVSESAFSAKNDIDSQTQKRKIFDKDFHTQNKTSEKMKTVYEKRVYKTVTETQGRRGSQSLFLDNFNRLSFFQLSKFSICFIYELKKSK